VSRPIGNGVYESVRTAKTSFRSQAGSRSGRYRSPSQDVVRSRQKRSLPLARAMQNPGDVTSPRDPAALSIEVSTRADPIHGRIRRVESTATCGRIHDATRVVGRARKEPQMQWVREVSDPRLNARDPRSAPEQELNEDREIDGRA